MDIVKKWFKPKFVKDIQDFLDFANFYCFFIYGFSRRPVLHLTMLKTSSKLIIQSLINLANDGRNCDKDKARILLVFFASKDLTGVGNLIFAVKKAFNFLQHAFTQVPIF